MRADREGQAAIVAVLCFAALIVGFYSEEFSPTLGRNKQLGLLVGATAMLAGSFLEVRAGRRTLSETLRFWAIAAQACLLALLVRIYEVNNRIFFDVIILLITFGFIAHHHLPQKLRPPFFVLLGVGSIVALIGTTYPLATVILIGLSLALFLIANLPIPLTARVVTLLIVGAGLAAMRVGWLNFGWASIAIPLLGSVFMFRLAIYLYDSHNKKGPTGFWAKLSYFFLPPNPVFPFFPVVDYATFGRSYYNEDANKIYQRGVGWILRGVIHLLVYRIDYLFFNSAPGDVTGPLSLLGYILTNFGLYFRISGSFHLIIGLLLIFGYNLPETHTSFYLSNSFIDFWRRINIYWKDFMQKMFFNPSYVRLKNAGRSHLFAVTAAIAVTFLATWALHSYNFFWLQGSLLFNAPDALFWGALAAFLMTQTALEDGRSAARRDAKTAPRLSSRIELVVRTGCTLLTISLLWSMWTSPSLSAWIGLLAAGGVLPAFKTGAGASAVDWAVTAAWLAVGLGLIAVTMGVGLAPLRAPPAARKGAVKKPPIWRRSEIVTPVLAAALLLPHYQPIKALMNVDTQLFLEHVASSRLNARDQALASRGYYEEVSNAQRFNSPLWEVFMFRPKNFQNTEDMAGMRQRRDYMKYEYTPGATFSSNGVMYHINRWGMRDQDYELATPPNTSRVAMIGSSRLSGMGVDQNKRFESVIEARLNQEAAKSASGGRFEFLNFGVEAYEPIQVLMTLNEKVWRFHPSAVFHIAGSRDATVDRLAELYRLGRPTPFPFLDEIYQRAGLDRAMSNEKLNERLEPYKYEILGRIYQLMVEDCRAHGATPIWFYTTGAEGMAAENPQYVARVTQLAKDAGFVILELPDVMRDYDPTKVRLATWDRDHVNALGHSILANAIYTELRAMKQRTGVDLLAGSPMSMRGAARP